MRNLISAVTASMLIFFSPLDLSFSGDLDVATCLKERRVSNFTSNLQLSGDASRFDHLLRFSIQNLRFTDPASIPRPRIIVLPETVPELATAVSCCRLAKWSIRLRSGGHSYEGLSSISEDPDFVIVDLMNLNRVSIDMETKTAWVQAGATLGEIYHAISEQTNRFGFPGGSCPSVGSGGHITGGGFGMLSRKYGLAADNVIDAVLIDASGRILDRDGMGEDVFWAIRGGGGGNWGAVTAWKLQIREVSRKVSVFAVSRPGTRQQVAALVHKWQSVGPNLEGDFYLSVIVGAGLPGMPAPKIYLGPAQEALSSIKAKFPELRVSAAECREMSWIDSVVFFSGLREGSTVSDLKNRFLYDKNYFKAKSDYVRSPLPLSAVKEVLSILEEQSLGYVILDPYGGEMARISPDSIPFPHRDGNLYNIQYMVAWAEEDARNSDAYMKWLMKFYEHMTPYVSMGPRAAYINYVDLDLGKLDLNATPSNAERAREWGERYFLGNYDRLVKVKRKWDPCNVFSDPQSIPALAVIAKLGHENY